MGRSAVIGIMAYLAVQGAGAAVTLFQTETFSDFGGWSGGNPNPNPPSILQDSGPMGGGDFALRVAANGGSGPGGKLVIFNRTEWTGNFVSAGITAIGADLRNSGTTPLSMRLAFNGPGGWFATERFILTAFSGWTQAEFDIQPGVLVSAGGSDAAGTMAAVGEMRILHSAVASFQGAQVSSGFLLDNIRAVPEPSSAMMVCLLSLNLLFRNRGKCRFC